MSRLAGFWFELRNQDDQVLYRRGMPNPMTPALESHNGPAPHRHHWAAGRTAMAPADVLASPSIDPFGRLWLLLRPGTLDDGTLHQWAMTVAEHALAGLNGPSAGLRSAAAALAQKRVCLAGWGDEASLQHKRDELRLVVRALEAAPRTARHVAALDAARCAASPDALFAATNAAACARSAADHEKRELDWQLGALHKLLS